MSRLGQIEHVVAAADFSGPGQAAAVMAHRIAVASDAALSLVHVEEPIGSSYPGSAALIPKEIVDRVEQSVRETSERQLEDLRASISAGRPPVKRIETVALIGSPAAAIERYAVDEEADLIVLGGRGRSQVRAWLLGSVARALSTDSPSPVLLVRPGDETRFDGTFHRILVGIDYSPAARLLVETAAGLLARGGLLELVHVATAPTPWSIPDDVTVTATMERASQARLDHESDRLRRFSEEIQLGQTHVALDVEVGGAADMLLEHAAGMHADLIAVGAHRRERISEKLLGTVADRVLRHSNLPVLLLPGPAVAPGSGVRVLVTGATGFIGRHVVAELRERGDEPVALARSSSNLAGLEGVEIARGDMTRPETLDAAIDGADAVIHLAALLKAPWRADFSSTNVEGAANVARACAAAARVPALIVVSSLAAAGPAPAGELRDETMPPIPVSRYGRAKLAAERAARRAGGGVPITVVRPPMVLGEHDRGSLPLFRAAARGLAVAPVRARCEVSVVHARDLARALVAAAERGERVDDLGAGGTGVYYAPATEAIDFLELGRAVGRALGRRVLGLRLPAPATWVANAAAEVAGRLTDRPGLLSLDKHREATAGSWTCSGAKLRDHLAWSPEPLEQRLEETAAWYRSAGWL